MIDATFISHFRDQAIAAHGPATVDAFYKAGEYLAVNFHGARTNGDGGYTMNGSRGDVYTVTAETCGCPAYVKPIEKNDPPKFCYHRAIVIILQLIDASFEMREQEERRELALMRYKATMDAGALPADLGRDLPALPAAQPIAETDFETWAAEQSERGRFVHPTDAIDSVVHGRRALGAARARMDAALVRAAE